MKAKGSAATDCQLGQKREPTPLLRFPVHRGSGDWETKLLRQIATLHKGRGISKAEISVEGSQPCIRYGELYTIYGEVIHDVVSATHLPASGLLLSKKNDVILPASGETKIDIATASCVTHDGIALGSDLNIVRTGEDGIFLSYYFNGALKNTIAKLAQGDAVVHLYQSQLELLSIPLPSHREQRKIAECLSSIDELITAEARKLGALKAYKKGLMQQLFPAEGETIPRLRFPEFRDAGKWEETELGDMLLAPPTYGVNAAAVPYSTQLPTYLRITDISEDGHFIARDKVSVAVNVDRDNYLEEGDIVLARTGASVGKSYRYTKDDGELVFAGFLIRIKPNLGAINAILLSNFLLTGQYWSWVKVVSARSGQPGINGPGICFAAAYNSSQKRRQGIDGAK